MGVAKYSVRYPWEKWFSEKKFTIYAKLDYACGVSIMVREIRIRAREYNSKRPPSEWLFPSIRVSPDEKSISVVLSPKRLGGPKGAA